MSKTAYECSECGAIYQEPTICAGSPVVDGAITDYTKSVHDPTGVGYTKVYQNDKTEEIVGTVGDEADDEANADTPGISEVWQGEEEETQEEAPAEEETGA